jgi:hypothetical protein
MRAIRASLATRLGAAAVVAVLATGGAIAAATAAGAARSHQKPRETALSIKHKAIRSLHSSCGRHDGLASQESRDEAKMGCGRDRGERLGHSDGRDDREDPAEADGRHDHDRRDEAQQRHQAKNRE